MSTYRLGSNKMVYTPNIVRAAMAEYAHRPEWAIKLLTEGWSLPAAAATALLTKAVPYTVEDEAVVFTVEDAA